MRVTVERAAKLPESAADRVLDPAAKIDITGLMR
jgi:hypothetical protein